MIKRSPKLPVARRSFLTRLSAGLATFGATTAAVGAAQAPAAQGGQWQPSRHSQDDWFDRIPGKHRFVFDTITPEGIGRALLYANNYFEANRTGYELQNTDLAVVIVVRHNSTPFAYNDAIWSKYSAPLAQQSGFNDPKTKQPATANLYNASGFGSALQNLGITLESVLKRGAQLAVCQMATRAYAGSIARAVGANTDGIYNELVSNLVANCHMVPAGIVAVDRAQERGYSFVSVG